MPDDQAQPLPSAPAPRPAFWRSRPMVMAGLVTVVGLVLWIMGVVLAEPAQSGGAASGAAGGLVSALTDRSTPEASADPGSTSRQLGFGGAAGPLFAKLGGSFMIAFAVGYAFRKFLKLAILIGGVIAIGVFAMQRAGVASIDWASVQQHVSDSFAWLRGEAEGFRTLVAGALPSAAAAGFGLFMGFRRG